MCNLKWTTRIALQQNQEINHESQSNWFTPAERTTLPNVPGTCPFSRCASRHRIAVPVWCRSVVDWCVPHPRMWHCIRVRWTIPGRLSLGLDSFGHDSRCVPSPLQPHAHLDIENDRASRRAERTGWMWCATTISTVQCHNTLPSVWIADVEFFVRFPPAVDDLVCHCLNHVRPAARTLVCPFLYEHRKINMEFNQSSTAARGAKQLRPNWPFLFLGTTYLLITAGFYAMCSS